MTRESLHEILNGDTKKSHVYGRAMCVIIVFSLLPLCFKNESALPTFIEWSCVSVFIVDYLARWCTADYYLKKGAVSFLLYPFTPMAIIDLLSILPVFFALNPAWKALRVLRLLRLLRAFKLIRYSRGMTAVVKAVHKERESLLAVLALSLSYVMISALIVFNVEPQTFNTFFDCVYWAMVSLTTVGYGDLYPVTTVGRFIAMVSSFVGVAIVALPAGILTAGLMRELNAPEDADAEPEDEQADK